MVNGGKTVVEIDLKSEDGKRDFRALVEQSDAFLESYRPGVLDRLGFGHEALHEMNPGIVSCSLSGWGLEGPYRLRGGHDINYMGLMGGFGALRRARAAGGLLPADRRLRERDAGRAQYHGGLLGRSRNEAGRGATIDVSIAEDRAALAGLGAERALPQGMGRPARRAVSQWRGRVLQHLRDQ